MSQLASSPLKITPVILCGGSGTRLWPLSRSLYPKQFYPLVGEGSLFLQTLMRANNAAIYDLPIVVASQHHQFLVEKEMKAAGLIGQLILEPCARNTTPAITLAALAAMQKNPDAVLLIMPSDHLIEPIADFNDFVQKSLPSALKGELVTFGVTPTRPETGYGYIQRSQDDTDFAKKVLRFVEKPTLEKAEVYLQSGDFLWNSGLFLFQAKAFLEAVKTYQPLILDSCAAAFDVKTGIMDTQVFEKSPSVSIDYGIMEQASNVRVAPLTVNWNDLGSWQALWEVDNRDKDGNTILGDVVTHNVSQSYIRSEGRLVTVVGLEGVIVVESQDAILVASQAASQDVKHIVDTLKLSERPHTRSHSAEERPWGSFKSVDKGERFQVKHITVKPGQKLSLQMHHHRAEHWIVVSGTAKVTRGEEELMVFENQSIYIPCGTKHRLENPGKIPLELIEVQSGPYLGEDDIVRFGDDYGRF
ncbi:mannose-1-phosphate guanylyltransferase/mannose-6-phosphate isomerase [Candidatus Finniella inopinata]|uniref:mannose-1-phosphate guanylyltransferase n=1 Tax=Candidatus Finniella inopinata TaxID=1696036 RepID=A0A4Q7DJQ2_9PROT|nr:mannose-1-phosphate guanylyltransferase/mannose-6-phosphate isomerase [Candidatus Finniella inopinata]RZI47103.1 mannose-1-phosphate guanylyltransferase/mannose-6-phosphate isomerase [Candidatus Finniella inopinata]